MKASVKSHQATLSVAAPLLLYSFVMITPKLFSIQYMLRYMTQVTFVDMLGSDLE